MLLLAFAGRWSLAWRLWYGASTFESKCSIQLNVANMISRQNHPPKDLGPLYRVLMFIIRMSWRTSIQQTSTADVSGLISIMPHPLPLCASQFKDVTLASRTYVRCLAELKPWYDKRCRSKHKVQPQGRLTGSVNPIAAFRHCKSSGIVLMHDHVLRWHRQPKDPFRQPRISKF